MANLPVATRTSLGAVKVGDTLTITSEGVLNSKSIEDIDKRLQEASITLEQSKEGLAVAITSKGVDTTASDTFEQMAENIIAIPSGGGDLDGFIEGTLTDLQSNATSVATRKFSQDTNIVNVTLPEAQSVGDYAFYQCPNLVSASVPKATRIGSYGFYACPKLKTVNAPNVESVGTYALNNNRLLEAVNLSKVKTVLNNAFENCVVLKRLEMPYVETIRDYAFSGCTALTYLDISRAKTIYRYVFYNCSNLTTIDLSKTTAVCSYQNTSSSYDPKNANLQILVPSALLSAYKTATNWSRLADKFVGV